MAGFTTYRDFPYVIPIVDASLVGPQTFFPVGVDKDTIFKWYYRVKEWELEIAINLSASVTAVDSSASAAATSPIVRTTIINSALLDESFFSVEQPYSTADEATDGDRQETIGSTSTSIAEYFYVTGFATYEFLNTIYYHDGLYYPLSNLAMSLSVQGEFFATDGFKVKGRQVDSSYFGGTTVSIPWTIDGNSFNAEGTYSNSEGGSSVLGSITVNCDFVSINLTPKEYWPYDPGDGGGPIYSAVDGSALRDPFSVQP